MSFDARLKQIHSRSEGSTLNERRCDRRMKEKLMWVGGAGQGPQLQDSVVLARCSMARASSAEVQGDASCRPSTARSCCSASGHKPCSLASTSAEPTASLFHSAFQNPAALTMEWRAPLFAERQEELRRRGWCWRRQRAYLAPGTGRCRRRQLQGRSTFDREGLLLCDGSGRRGV